MKKVISITLAIMMFLGVSITAQAVEPRASNYFDGYLLGLSAKGNSQMSVSFAVLGTSEMDKVGVYSLEIQEKVGTDTWSTTFTVYGSSDTDTFYSYNTHDHVGEYFFAGIPGVTYRAVMVAYASNSSGHEYSREIVCTEKVCK